MKPWDQAWAGRFPPNVVVPGEIDFETAQERSKFMIEAAKILVRLDPQLLHAQFGLTHPRDLDTSAELHFEDHIEALALGWITRFPS